MIKRFGCFVMVTLIAAGCGKEAAQSVDASKAYLTVQSDGSIRSLSAEDAQQICNQQYCEKNQVYRASFGRKRTPQPEPVIPIVTPSPVPSENPELPTTDQESRASQYALSILKASNAWKITEGSPAVTVAIVDTGIDVNHIEFKNNLWRDAQGQAGYDFVNQHPNAIDDNGHGTHCAGIIAAERNGVGILGIAPKVKVMPLKFLDRTGSGDTLVAIQAIDYAIEHGAQVISNSWGGDGYSELLNQAIQRALAKGIHVVAAAGNESVNNDQVGSYPANYLGVVSVGSSDSADRLSSFSNYGKNTVTIVAPGSSIYSTFPSRSYRNMSGTSMATPYVAGALALAKSLSRTFSHDTLERAMCLTSENKLRSYSQCGRMNVGEYITQLANTP
jgi:subtilisin family serine protease